MNKHEKIYELTGIEPDYWACGDNLFKSYGSNGGRVPVEIGDFKVTNPHYPCEQLWEMMPSEILPGSGTGYYLMINSHTPGGYGREIGYFIESDFGFATDLNTDLISFKIDNLQEALLDMVLWAIEQNHIKKVSE
jgi:hypothetical protein